MYPILGQGKVHGNLYPESSDFSQGRFKATVKALKDGDVVSEVVLDVGGQEMCAVITTGSVQKMGLKAGDEVAALVKASSVMLMK